MNPFEESLFKKGYVKLQLGSYRIWMGKKWHEMFVRRGLVRKNFFGQFTINKDSLEEFCRWLTLYDKLEHDRDYPKSNKFLTEEEIIEIRAVVV